jgi:hypothetical protein
MELFTGIFGLIVGLVALALAVSWLVFPWLVCRKIDQLRDNIRSGNVLLSEVRTLLRSQSAGGPPEPAEEACFYLSVRDETTGPFTLAHIEASLLRGLIDAKTPAIKKGEKAWSTVGDLLPAAKA